MHCTTWLYSTQHLALPVIAAAMALRKLFTDMRKRTASNHDDDALEENSLLSESDTESTDFEPTTKHPRIENDSVATESISTSELPVSGSSTSAVKNK